MYFCHYAYIPVSITERLNIHFNEWFPLSSHVSWMVLGTGGNLQKARAETESSMLEVHGDTLWQTTVREGKGTVYWEKPNWKPASCAGLVSLLRSSENGVVCLQSLNGGEECGSLSCHPGKGGQDRGRVTISNNSNGLSLHLSASDVVPYPTDEWSVDSAPSWSTPVEKRFPTPSSGVEHITTSPSHALATCIPPKETERWDWMTLNCVQSLLMISPVIESGLLLHFNSSFPLTTTEWLIYLKQRGHFREN